MVREALTLERLSAMNADDAAAHFLFRRAEGLTDHETALLEAWLGADKAHEAAFAAADHAWSLFDDAADHDLLDAMREHARLSRSSRWAGRRPLAAVAAMLLLIAGTGWLLVGQSQNNAPLVADSAIRYVAGREAVKEIALADGSRLTLDAGSSVIARFGANRRAIELERGRAFLSVAHDRTRPFTVDAGGQRVTAVGTQFDVQLSDGAVSVTLLEGRVTIRPAVGGGDIVTLEPNQRFISRGGKASVQSLGAGADEQTSWRRGLLNFEDQTLAGAVNEANRYSREKIIIRDPQVAALHVSGQFRAGDAQRLAATLAELHQLRTSRHADGIELSKK